MPEEEAVPEVWRCVQCGKEFDCATFSHSNYGPQGEEVECGPIERFEPGPMEAEC
jgi:hypothetical protein